MKARNVRHLVWFAASMLAASSAQANIRIVVPPPKNPPPAAPPRSIVQGSDQTLADDGTGQKATTKPIPKPDENQTIEGLENARNVVDLTTKSGAVLNQSAQVAGDIKIVDNKLLTPLKYTMVAVKTADGLYRGGRPEMYRQLGTASVDFLVDRAVEGGCAYLTGPAIAQCKFGAEVGLVAMEKWTGKSIGGHAVAGVEIAYDKMFPEIYEPGSEQVGFALKKQALRKRMTLLRENNDAAALEQSRYIVDQGYDNGSNEADELASWNAFMLGLNSAIGLNQNQSVASPGQSSSRDDSAPASCPYNSDDDPSTVCTSN